MITETAPTACEDDAMKSPSMIRRAIWLAVRAPFLLLITLISSSAFCATLPLDDGEYTGGRCEGGSDIGGSIGLPTLSDGAQKGRRFLSPYGEGHDGYCFISKIDVSDARFSGSAKCRSCTKIYTSLETYRFTNDILHGRAFVSKGSKYFWCLPHR